MTDTMELTPATTVARADKLNISEHNRTFLEKISVRQAEALVALTSGSTLKEAAERAGVSRTTLYEWRNNAPAFITELNRLRQDKLDAVQTGIQNLAVQSLNVLRELLTDKSMPPAVRLRAALAALNSIDAMTPPQPGPTAEDQVRTEQEVQRQEQLQVWNRQLLQTE